MTENHGAESLVQAVRDGTLTFEFALEEHLEGRCDEPVETTFRTLAYHNMGWQDRVLELSDRSITVAEFVKKLGLEPFLPLLDRHEDLEFSLGDLVIYEGQAYQVIGRREVSPFATPRFDDFELLIEALDGSRCDFVGENVVESVEDEE